MNVKFYAIVNNGKKKILLANWCVNVETFERDILLYKTGMAVKYIPKLRHFIDLTRDFPTKEDSKEGEQC